MPINSSKNHQGFTLIELLVVIVIIGISMAVIAPNMGAGKQGAQLKAAARDIASALRYARGYALTTQKEATLSLDLTTNTYQITGKSKGYHLNDDIDLTLETAQSELNGEGLGKIRFFADGSSSGGRVTLERGEKKWLVDISWLTGQVDINEK